MVSIGVEVAQMKIQCRALNCYCRKFKMQVRQEVS